MKRKIITGIIMTITLMAALSCGGNKSGETLPSVQGGNNVIPVKTTASNVYFIKTDQGYLMVDAGLLGGEKRIKKLFTDARINPEDVQLIILTHGHGDHLGGLADIKRLTGAPVLAHKNTVHYLAEGKDEPVVPSNLKGKILHAITPPVKLEKCVPEIITDEEYDLTSFGIKGKIIHTPGHSPGSIAIILENGEALVGDLVRGKKKELTLGMFYDDKNMLIKSLKKVASYNSEIIYMSHGTFTDSKTLAAYLKEVQ